MTLDQVPTGAPVFVDSNILVYHFQPHPSFGPACHRLLERIFSPGMPRSVITISSFAEQLIRRVLLRRKLPPPTRRRTAQSRPASLR